MTSTSNTSSEQGFTLIELLVVILIIGILAAIAIPAFLGQRQKAQDSDAKADARNMVTQIESCYQRDQTYVGCAAFLTSAETGLPVGGGIGEVRIDQETLSGYEISATSKADSAGDQHVYRIIHNIGGVYDQLCVPAGRGGCKADGTW